MTHPLTESLVPASETPPLALDQCVQFGSGAGVDSRSQCCDGDLVRITADIGEAIAAIAQMPVNLPEHSDWLFHCLVPAAHWWDDIVYT